MSPWWRRIAPFIGIALVIAALWTLRSEFAGLSLGSVGRALDLLPASAILLSLGLTAASYVVLTGYDLLAFVYLGRRFPKWQIVTASFVGYAVSNTVGMAMLSGASARYRFYSRWGLSGSEISRIVVFYSGTFWLGLLVLGGAGLLTHPPHGLPAWLSWVQAGAMPLGAALVGLAVAYAVGALARRRPFTVFGQEISFPAPRLVAGQFLLSTADWALAAAVLWALIPAPRPPFLETASAFVIGQGLGIVLQIPGALGAFEITMFAALGGVVPQASLVSALLLFRIIYYVLPLAAALVVLLADEWYQRRHIVRRWGNAFGTLTLSITPKLLAAFTFLSGAVLLFSGATPAETNRLRMLRHVFKLPVIELSHFLNSLVGLFLLLVSQSLARRVDAAWTIAVALLSIGIAVSLTKGFDYEEASFLMLVLVLLVAARAEFDRRSTVFGRWFSGGWLFAVTLVVIASAVLGEFAYRHVQYSEELFWQFAFRDDVSRFLRATVGVAIVLAAIGVRYLLRPAPPIVPVPDEAALDAAAPVIAAQRTASAYLVYLRDKGVLWNDERTAFVMYGVQSRSWVALHDPVGPPAAVPGLIRKFMEMVDDADGVPVFYEIRKEYLHRYADFGLAFAKAGEEALVPLPAFSLDGGARKKMRLIMHRLEKDGGRFRLLSPAEVPAVLPELRAVSDAWLRSKGGSEKGFSLGFFDASYLSRLPVLVLEVNGRIEAFANLWPGPRKIELSVDLMRFRPTAPRSAMECLLIHLMLWGQAEGYEWFNLGMAPLSGLETTALAPLRVRIATYLYRYGDLFYNFQGLREYKEKFDPVWEPAYLAYPGGLSLPRVLADVSALIAGGYQRFLIRRSR